MDEQKTITIALDEYKAMIRIKERIAVLARLIENVEYINTGEVVAVLDIDLPKKGEARK
jgi:hypothetical protein